MDGQRSAIIRSKDKCCCIPPEVLNFVIHIGQSNIGMLFFIHFLFIITSFQGHILIEWGRQLCSSAELLQSVADYEKIRIFSAHENWPKLSSIPAVLITIIKALNVVESQNIK